MRFLSIIAGIAAGTACASSVDADPYGLLAPDDPAYHSRWRPPAPPTTGLETYRPVATRNWFELNKRAGSMRGIPGMDSHSGMSMPGMEGGR